VLNFFKNISNNKGNSQQALAIAISNTNVYIGKMIHQRVERFCTSADRGNTFNPIFTNLSTDDGDAFTHDIAVSSS
jgi:carbamate kinase